MNRKMFTLLAIFIFASGAYAVSLVSKSNGLEVPEKEAGHTELEIADINCDGNLDIISVGDHGSPYVNSGEHGIMIWFGDGSGNWSVVQSGEFGYGGCAVGDLNLDGFPDVAWGIHHDWGTGGFGDKLMGAALGDGTGLNWVPWDEGLAENGEDWGMFATELADFDLDGDLDIACESFGADNGVRIYENHMDGTWTQTWLIDGWNSNYTIEAGDFNADGYQDFICTRWGTNIYFNNGFFDYTLNQAGIPYLTMVSVDCGDFNGDGRDDIVCSLGSDSGVHCYYFDDGSAQWIDASEGLPDGGDYCDMVQFGYIDGDEHLDLVLYDDPVGQVYLGSGTGIWTADASWTMPASGDASAIRIDGDIDHDGREDIAIQGEQTGGIFDRNQLRVYSPWLEPSQLSVRVLSPDGGEILYNGSIREIRWLSSIPLYQGQALVDLFLSVNGAGGPWTIIASDIPDNGSYQWKTGSELSTTCRIKAVVTTATDKSEDISDNDFSIAGLTGLNEEQSISLSDFDVSIIPNPASGIPVLISAGNSDNSVQVEIYDITGRLVNSFSVDECTAAGIPVTDESGCVLDAGIYILRVSDENCMAVARLVQLPCR